MTRPARRSPLEPSLLALLCAVLVLVPRAAFAQTYDCTSTDPADWPPAARPYFMLAVDTSGSMIGCTNPSGGFQHPNSCPSTATPNSCGLEPTRLNDAKCALRKTVQAFGGEVNFGLATFAVGLTGCGGGACGDSCTAGNGTCDPPNGLGNAEGEFYAGNGCSTVGFADSTSHATCGNQPDCATPNYPIFGDDWRNGGNVVVDMLQDPVPWNGTPPASNVATLLSWFDGQCDGNRELFALGATPLEGVLRTSHQYLANGWLSTWRNGNYCAASVPNHPKPLTDQDPPCRVVNVILVTDGDESCNGSPPAAAAALYNTGVVVNGQTVRVRTHVINFAGGNQTATDDIADAGDDGNAANNSALSFFANGEAQLSAALANIVAGASRPEVCNNTDDNCNGCIDEGYGHYCHTGQACCSWGSTAQRTTCINNYLASITGADPDGNPALLPCTTIPQSNNSATWLCYDPGEICDNVDNNCNGVIDENQTKCGTPAHCPIAETCNNDDDNCDGVKDNAAGSGVPFSVCPGGCQSSPEICDGCDNDCDGQADDGVPTVPCGLSNPPNCSGTRTCPPRGPVTPGQCVPGGNTYGNCQNNPQTEICDGLDNNCNGIVDDGVPPTACEVPLQPNLFYQSDALLPPLPPGRTFAASQCVRGQVPCNGACSGYVGPSTEVCDGIDNDCDGVVDDGIGGLGQPCGTDTGACSKGTTACVGGTVVCTGGTLPQPEVCNGIDDDCDNLVDDAPLGDAPAAGSSGCWTQSGSCCTHQNLQWCPPTGATCNALGSLTAPCQRGTLVCTGATRWACQGAQPPGPEVCDGNDNDCDGAVDDGVPPPGTTCGTSVGECEFGGLQCVNGTSQCVGGTGPQPEVCNGKDDDCDGQTDEGVPGVGIACGTDTGACRAGLTACVSGAIVCQGEIKPGAETCNNVDDDCDGAVDDGPLGDAPASPGCWRLPGNCCTHDGFSWCPPTGGTCSGAGSLTTPCGVGRLECTAGAWSCQGGQTPNPEICDGADNDCDGTADDGNPGGGGACGQTDVGECQRGNLVCQNGSIVCIGEIGPTPELCNAKDDDCDGQVDDNVPGTGNPCGVSTGQCRKGTTACLVGTLVCQGGVTPQPEECNGLDDDCDGFTDDGPLTDSPPSPGCWQVPGTTCSWENAQWSPPPGGTCDGLGGLQTPCAAGQLACVGANGWLCQGGRTPTGEVCDGADNNCNGTIDEGNPQGGGVCGTDVGDCVPGTLVCVGGTLDCQGETVPEPETCNGEDDDCDGTPDNGIPIGGTCFQPYDEIAYPGDRTKGQCKPGQNACDGAGGLICVGGTGPAPEICDNVDNDCDGQTDEPGPQPDGIDGTTDPSDSSRRIGDACGVDVGECRQGQLACDSGQVVCLGGVGPQPEICDCADNDCDGQVDDDPATGSTDPALCSPGKTCVNAAAGNCQCAAPCGGGEVPCPTGLDCKDVTKSGSGEPRPRHCVNEGPCGDCSKKTFTDSQGDVECAPEGTPTSGGVELPECVCKGQAGCRSPCFQVACPAGQRCVPAGAATGTCQPDNNCNFFGCPDGKACHNEACVDNPCDPNPCGPNEVCKPTADFSAHNCAGSCANVDCPAGESCDDGVCVPTGCGVDCPAGEHCLPEPDAGASCGPSKCQTTCSNGAYCDPVTGGCVDDPCEGVVCPTAQDCAAGECRWTPEGGTDAGAGGAGGSGGGTGATGGRSGSGGGAPDASAGTGGGSGTAGETERSDKVWGLATGGGGCACKAASPSRLPPFGWALLGLFVGAAFARRALRRDGGGR